MTTLPCGCSATWWPGELGAHSCVWESNLYPWPLHSFPKRKQKWLCHVMPRIGNHLGSILFQRVPGQNHLRTPGKRQEARKIAAGIRFSCPNASSCNVTNVHKYGVYIQASVWPSESPPPAVIYLRLFSYKKKDEKQALRPCDETRLFCSPGMACPLLPACCQQRRTAESRLRPAQNHQALARPGWRF